MKHFWRKFCIIVDNFIYWKLNRSNKTTKSTEINQGNWRVTNQKLSENQMKNYWPFSKTNSRLSKFQIHGISIDLDKKKIGTGSDMHYMFQMWRFLEIFETYTQSPNWLKCLSRRKIDIRATSKVYPIYLSSH